MGSLEDLRVDRLCNFVFWKLTHNLDEKDLQKFVGRLWLPPAGEVIDSRSPWSAESETNSFAAFQTQVGKTRAPLNASG